MSFCPTGLIFPVREADRMVISVAECFLFSFKASCFCFFVDCYIKATLLLAFKTSSLLRPQFYVCSSMISFNADAQNDACPGCISNYFLKGEIRDCRWKYKDSQVSKRLLKRMFLRPHRAPSGQELRHLEKAVFLRHYRRLWGLTPDPQGDRAKAAMVRSCQAAPLKCQSLQI